MKLLILVQTFGEFYTISVVVFVCLFVCLFIVLYIKQKVVVVVFFISSCCIFVNI